MKTTKDTIDKILELFNESYAGRFPLTDRTPVIWLKMLQDFDAETVLAAAYHLAATHRTWPPDLATVRDQAARLAHGEKTAPTGSDSWERVLMKILKHPEVILSELERKALAQVSTIYDLRRSTAPAADRARYIKAFDDLVAKQQLDRVTLPEVQALVDRHMPELPAHQEAPQLPEETDTDSDTDPDTDCVNCGHPATHHALDDGEGHSYWLQGCLHILDGEQCTCTQYECRVDRPTQDEVKALVDGLGRKVPL